jgi:GNAT superfamily N-acetyltransferase
MAPAQSTHRGLVVEALHPQDLAEATTVLAGSYQTYPNFTALYPDPVKRARALPWILRSLLRDALPLGGVQVARTASGMVGVAVWLPPGTFPMSGVRQARLIPDIVRLLFVDALVLPRLMRLQSNALDLHPRAPHRYLAALGVAREAQGQGVGSLLLAAGLHRADAAGMPCYLETESPRNVLLYEAHGFQVLTAGPPLLPDGPQSWRMWRPGRSA